MGLVHLIVILFLVGLVVWACNYLFGDKMSPELRTTINRVAVVGVVVLAALWLLSVFGVLNVDFGRAVWGR